MMQMENTQDRILASLSSIQQYFNQQQPAFNQFPWYHPNYSQTPNQMPFFPQRHDQMPLFSQRHNQMPPYQPCHDQMPQESQDTVLLVMWIMPE